MSILDDLLNVVASAIGSLTNASKLSRTFMSEKHVSISSTTIERYLGYFEEAFLISKANRYDVKESDICRLPANITSQM